ncbi:S41 family peptidase [Paraferrimonas haliotis]|uniref:Carboxyl-terminal processing protease n=1 Tax=Paraferrimonas haliotis TaxID=2013866 RepID=A0AA37TK45_9GAMM|nr:S41 family peptidase [Paraferrimonas haliotis]GLS82033.1 carboxyl-terminal processing protease [Paraferrimonas haliotis]
MTNITKFVTGMTIGLTVGLSVSLYSDEFNEGYDGSPKWDILVDVIDRVEAYYVTDFTHQQLVDMAISGLFAQLDPHSQFLNADELAQLSEANNGAYFGFGIEIAIVDDNVQILSALENSPAHRAGVRSGDVIKQVDAMAVSQANYQETLAYIRHQSNHEQAINLWLESQGTPLQIELLPAQIQIQSVKWQRLPHQVDYLRISSFQHNTAASVAQHLTSLTQDSKGLILDLRNNPGGILEQAIDIADMMLDGGRIVATKGRVFDSNSDYYASSEHHLREVPITVLINHGSASAAEILAAALADNGKAVLIGETSYGKTSVQSLIPTVLPNTAIKLTTARYYTASGQDIHQVGITPDILAQEHSLSRAINLPVNNGLTIHKGDSLKDLSDDIEVALAMEWLLNERTLLEQHKQTTTSSTP